MDYHTQKSVLSAAALLLISMAVTDAKGAEVDFNKDVRPILSDNCFACHGLDEKKRKADLRLDSAEGAFADLGGYQAIHPGKLEKSALWDRITTDDKDDVMPPPKSHKELTSAQVATLKKWIEEGAKYDQHWSFVAPVKPGVPEVAGGRNEIDGFLRARLREEGLSASDESDKETLIRRVTLDLTGLPPTPEEVDAFLADNSPDAYEKLVEGLLGRVTYGENMARPWLDLARYADTHGLHLDNERSMWPYRDWVVRALNANIPFDDFTRWQLAGDLLEEPTQDQLIASGFNRCNVTTGEGGSINEEWIYRYAVERTTATVEVWMGMTAGCAVCHDHKFDPISAKEFYSMYVFFHSAADPAMDGNKIDTPPILRIVTPEMEDRVKELEAKIAAIDGRKSEAMAKIEYRDPGKLVPPPPAQETEVIWFEDAFQPEGKYTAVGNPQKLVNKSEGEVVFSGGAAVKRTASGLAQDVLEGGVAFEIPENGKVFAYCFLDPKNPPETVMLQFYTNGWNHRAVWGAQAKIPWGKPKTAEKVLMGGLPKAGEWVRLEVEVKKMGLNPGTKVTGYAFTQFGGTVTWDKLGIQTRTDVANDPQWSYSVWVEQNQGKQIKALPEELRKKIRGKRADKWSVDEAREVREYWLGSLYAGAREIVAPIEAEKAPLAKEKADIEKARPLTFVMADLPKPRESFVMIRGAYDNKGEKVKRGVPEFLPGLPERPEGRDYNRLDLADWLVNGEHPLTARVAVNRFWQQFFGAGLVKTGADFGTQGELPSHPELLDWLAVRFVESGWDMKALVRLIVTSAAYRQNSKVTPELLEKDPENRLMARGPRLRLDAEVIRDQALSVSGLLVPSIGGKGVRPYQPPNIWEPVAFGGSNTKVYKQGTGEDLYRRSLYTFLKRTAPAPFMATFDAPNREQSCSARGRTNTPLQALQLMNDVQHVEAARNFAQRMMKEGGATPEARVKWAWRVVTARYPTDGETAVVLGAFGDHLERYRADAKAAGELISYGESKADPALDVAELAAFTMAANLILNLDEAITKN